MECPDESALQSLLGGAATETANDALWQHIDGCGDCLKVLAAMGHGDTAAARSQIRPRSSGGAETSRPDGPADPFVEDIAPGTRVGRYVVERFLGGGAFGAVYAGVDPELSRPIALKLLKSIAAEARPDAEARLAREAQAMARVSHPNVVAVFDSGVWNGRVFVAMERVDGADLSAWLKAAPRTVAEIVDVFIAAGRGLAAAHAVGLVHRDFKPSNVLVGSDGRVRVSDFGLARAMGVQLPGAAAIESVSGDAEGVLTQVGAVLGTPPYMAPEQHVGGDLDARTDQFAFCASLYEALYGRRPFGGGDYVKLREDIVAGKVRTPPDGSRVSRELHRIVLRGLEPVPGKRWPTLDALLRALGHDRAKVPRRVSAVAAALLGMLVIAFAGDRIVRARLYAVARESFSAARARLDHIVRLRYETFSALAELSTQVPVVRQVAALRDQSAFGFGSAGADHERFDELHSSLRDADWSAWRAVLERGALAVADYKGRLCYASADPAASGFDVRQVPAVAAAYDAKGSGSGAQVLPASDRLLTAGRLAGRHQGLELVFARTALLAGVPQAVFIQLLDGDRLLSELSIDPETRLTLIAPGGTAEGQVPAPMLTAARANRNELLEVSHQGRPWLVQSAALPGLERSAAPIATLVIARPADVGLAGLFPRARELLLVLIAIAAAALAWGLLAARANTRQLNTSVGR
jgi:hypothetical protein